MTRMAGEDGGSKNPVWLQNLYGKQVCILTFGCTYNEGDSEKLCVVLSDAGCQIVDSPDNADAIIINTCVVIARTERKMNRLIARYHDRLVYITGCMPLAYPEKRDLLSFHPVILPDEIHDLFFRVSHDIRVAGYAGSSVVQVAKGCPGHCSYCITKRARGGLVSFPADEILLQIREMAGSGVAEIRLTGQDVSAYGLDRESPSLPALLEEINQIDGNFMVRLGMMNPATLLPVLDDLLKNLHNGRIFSFLHIPVQSGSDRILSLMNRGYRVSDIVSIVSACRKAGGIRIATDVIVGFPGETEEDHTATMDLLRMMSPAMVNITRYSPREGTPAFSFPDMPDRIKKDRSRMLTLLRDNLLQTANRQMIDQVLPVLVTEKIRPGSVTARTRGYHNVLVSCDPDPGTRGLVRITGEKTHYLTGELIS
ncbi:MAG: tRNA (N(6)-L-threonylcarbamoyladenosine(37)-C(2))-methylthiotransferase [Methanospirillaceae archaeon]|nr:tRNA (N(6)-L-threonylcarbamoyladenosine(37)-C(2))-methylthiotransferase [Methanospirillaceae archaeon]